MHLGLRVRHDGIVVDADVSSERHQQTLNSQTSMIWLCLKLRDLRDERRKLLQILGASIHAVAPIVVSTQKRVFSTSCHEQHA